MCVCFFTYLSELYNQSFVQVFIVIFTYSQGTDYDLKRLVKANAQAACVIAYRITFVAADFAAYPNDQDTTFQAKVLLKLRGDIEILMCRIKPCR